MSEELKTFVNITFYLVALINPLSKVFFLSSAIRGREQWSSLATVSVRASGTAFLILLAFALLGDVLFKQVFHVELYSFQVVGGIVLFVSGFKALNKGVFFEEEEGDRLLDLSVVPLASPLIAGPATITGVISFSAQYGMPRTLAATFIAILFNFIAMLLTGFLYRLLRHYNLIGALIRITGLIVSTIAVQMVLAGLKAWHSTLALPAKLPGAGG